MRMLMDVLWMRSRRGFTLVELLVVVAIIGILAVAALPKITGAIDQSRQKRNVADVRVIANALDRFYADYGFYPPTLNELQDPQNDGKAYLKDNVSFKNAYGKYYFYAVRFDSTVANYTYGNFQEYVLGDPGKSPTDHAASASPWSSTSVALPEGIDPDDGAWMWDVLTGSATPNPAQNSIVPSATYNMDFVDQDGYTWDYGTAPLDVTLKNIGETPTRSDLLTE